MLSALATEGLLTLDSPVTPVQVDANICALLGGLDAPNALCSSTAVGGWEAAYQASGIGGGASATQLWGIGTTGQTGVFHGNDVQTFNYGIVPSAGVTPTNGFDTYPFVYHTATAVWPHHGSDHDIQCRGRTWHATGRNACRHHRH